MTSKIPASFSLSLLRFLLQNKRGIIELSSNVGLTTMQSFTLLLTDNNHPKSMNVFCKLYDCDASNITGIIDGLENKGLVERGEHPTDRRVKVIRLLPAGEKLKAEISDKLSEASSTLLQSLSEDEKKQFVALIDKLSLAAPDIL